jgi:hypothetical protein
VLYSSSGAFAALDGAKGRAPPAEWSWEALRATLEGWYGGGADPSRWEARMQVRAHHAVLRHRSRVVAVG